MQEEFWRKKPLHAMSAEEWEALCDGCARCCLVKLEDEDAGTVYFTNVACRLLNISSCRCTDYADRSRRVPGCLVLTPQNLADYLNILPPSCAYKRLYMRQDLPPWHPLVTGQNSSVHDYASVSGKCVSERYIHPEQLAAHVADWPEQEP